MKALATYLGISYESPEEKVLRILNELGAQFVGAEEGSLLVFDHETNDLVFAMTVGSGLSEEVLLGQRVPLGEGIVGLAAQTREVQIGAPTFQVRQGAERQTEEAQPKSVLAAPMLIGNTLIGIITAVSFRPDTRFTNDDAMLYARIATVAAVVVEQRRRLAAVESLQKGLEVPQAASEEERLDFEIVHSVTQLIKGKPAAKAQVARLLAVVRALLEAG